MGEVETRFLREVGTRASLRVYWGEDDCPNSYGLGRPGIHNVVRFLADSATREDWDLGGKPEQYPASSWPTQCAHCAAAVPPRVAPIPCDCGTVGCTRLPPGAPVYQVFHRRLYQPITGADRLIRDEFCPGDMYWGDWYSCAEGGTCPYCWTNCTGKHLMIELPNGRTWDVGSRASNCTLPEETTHRCWIIEGDPERDRITISKNGHTCNAGGGSIQAGDYHGVLQGGILRAC